MANQDGAVTDPALTQKLDEAAKAKAPQSANKEVQPVAADGPAVTDPNLIKQLDQAASQSFQSSVESRLSAGAAKKNQDQITHWGSSVRDRLAGKSPDVDYKTGTGQADEIAMAKAVNDSERDLYMIERYGPKGEGKWGRDAGGRYWVAFPDPKNPKTPHKFVVGTTEFFDTLLADTKASGPEIAAAGAGALIAGPEIIPAVLAATGGGMVGRGLTEIQKKLQGRSSQTATEMLGTIGKSGLTGGAGEMIGAPFAKGLSRVAEMRLPRRITGGSIETENLVGQSYREGVAPPIKSAFPGMKAHQFAESFANKLVSDVGENNRITKLKGRLVTLLKDAGVKDPDSALNQIMTGERLEATGLGKEAIAAAREYKDAIHADIEKTGKELDAVLDQHANDIDKANKVRNPSPSLHQAISDSIVEGRQGLSKAAGKAYERIDQITGGEPLVPTVGIKRQIKDLVASMPKAAPVEGQAGEAVFKDAAVKARLDELMAMPDKISFGEAQRIRTDLRDMATSEDLTPTRANRQYGLAKDAVDRAFDAASADPRAAGANKLLRATDEFYKKNIRKFEDQVWNKIVRDATHGLGEADPAVLAKWIVRDNYSKRTGETLAMLPEKIRREVGEADWRNIRDLTKMEDGTINPRKFANEIQDRETVLNKLYGTKNADEMRRLAKDLQATNQKIPTEMLEPGKAKDLRVAIEAKQTRLDTFMSEEALGALAKPGKDADAAVDWLTTPGKGERLGEIQKFYGETSPQMQKVREVALGKVLQSAVDRTESGAGEKIAGDALLKSLDGYTASQKAILFPGGIADDIRDIAKLANFWFPKSADGGMSAGLAAGSVKMALPFGIVHGPLQHGGQAAWAVYGSTLFWSFLRNHPNYVRLFALGTKDSGRLGQEARKITRASFEEFVQGSAFDIQDARRRSGTK